MYSIKVIEEGFVFDNPLPQLRSRHAYFPSLTMMDDGSIMATYVMGEAFESVDLTTMLVRSTDVGKSWKVLGPLLDKSKLEVQVSDTLKIGKVNGDRLVAVGYCFPRENAELPVANSETGGVLEDYIIFLESNDYGHSWERVEKLDTSFSEPVEASAPVSVLKNGRMAMPIANFPKWNGVFDDRPCGRLMVSDDCGKTWGDDAVTMRFKESSILVYEQRMCQLADGTIIVIAWNEDMQSGKTLPNHFSISTDNGTSFSQPRSTGIMGQTANLVHIDKNLIMAFHCIRKDTDKPGIYAYMVDLSKGEWNILFEEVVWEPKMPLKSSHTMAEVFSSLKFGQPSAIPIGNNEYIMVNWVIEEGQGRIYWRKLKVEVKSS
ncbi:BNR repeat-like domain-containing protein [Virgibacillus subterraneus]|uniref:BNR repeat-like domain-containing protein n=1 Tax=Virgibacillus subterraneus TaxID=621109 RepID=A0A1H9G5Z3_9BACI|nr:sialidase family protein [Virgibacillus subterraneus]SEQ45519.1 BNR repeat-like domain-containing protein [Virgibacillus subterraneus]